MRTAMDLTDLDRMSELSPFELKDTLIRLASRHSERLMLNAGRASPNFLATVPRHGFFQLGLFAMSEAERSFADMPEGASGLPKPEGIAARFEMFAQARRGLPGVAFLLAAVSYARRQLALSDGEFLQEGVEGVLGCNYPSPVRMLTHTEEIIGHYLREEMGSGRPLNGRIDLFAVEGATAGITYIFNSLRGNRLIAPGDTIAIGMPIFAPYIEIPQLNDYRLVELAIEADPEAGLAVPDRELDKLLDPQVKGFLLVNPNNPTSVKMNEAGVNRIAEIVARHRNDLIILTDDVYATFADNFVSLFAVCPQNTILLYSFSKYFGGYRMAPGSDRTPRKQHTRCQDFGAAGGGRRDALRALSLPRARAAAAEVHRPRGSGQPERRTQPHCGVVDTQQVQMALLALFGLMDEDDAYKQAIKRTIRRRHEALYRELGFEVPGDPNAIDYYTILDLEVLGARRYGRDFVDWLLAHTPVPLLMSH